MLKNSSIIVCGIVRNAGKTLARNISVINELLDRFGDYRVFVYENDSVDDTKKILQTWHLSDPERIHVSLNQTDSSVVIPPSAEVPGLNHFFCHRRIDKMAALRNHYLDYIESQGWSADYLMVVDLDVAGFCLDGILSSFGSEVEWDAVTAFGYSTSPRLRRRYHDTYALTLWDDKMNPQTEAKMAEYAERFGSLKPGDAWIRVASAFGGVAIYRFEAVKGLRYSEPALPNYDPRVEVKCEHFSLYKQMIDRGYDKIYINPSMRLKYQGLSWHIVWNFLRRKAGFVAVLLLLSLSSCGVAAKQGSAYSNTAGKDFPVMAWFTLYGPHMDATHFKELSDAGFNLAFSFLSDREELDSVLRGAEGTGVRVVASCGEMKTDPEGTVAHLKGNPNVAAYFIKDEPKAADMAELSELFRRVRAVDPSKLIYCNLFPLCGLRNVGYETYEQYVDAYCVAASPDFLSFDCYPVRTVGFRPDFYHNLEIISSKAREMGVPFWAFALSTAHRTYPVATLESMGLQIWSNIAYGAQGIEYFTFLSSLDGKFHDGPIDAEGQRTPVYDAIARINGDVHALQDIFLGCSVQDVSHLGTTLPQGTKALSVMPSGVSDIKCGEDGVLVSTFVSGGRKYMMMVNHGYERPQNVSIDFSRRVRRIVPPSAVGGGLSGETGASMVAVAAGSNDFVLLPGGMLLFRL